MNRCRCGRWVPPSIAAVHRELGADPDLCTDCAIDALDRAVMYHRTMAILCGIVTVVAVAILIWALV